MDWFQILSLIPSYIVAIGIWHGISVMKSEGKKRAELSARQAEGSIRRHEEYMDASAKRHEEFMKKHEESMVALRALIERTGG